MSSPVGRPGLPAVSSGGSTNVARISPSSRISTFRAPSSSRSAAIVQGSSEISSATTRTLADRALGGQPPAPTPRSGTQPGVDRRLAAKNIRTGLIAGAISLIVFSAAFLSGYLY